jgi:hypothetical protein
MATIAYLSNTRWPWCTEVHVNQALTELGHDVTLLQEDIVTVDDIEHAATDSDLFLFTRTWGNHDPAAMLALYDRLDRAGIPTASYHLDLYVGLDREATIAGDPFWSTRWMFHPDGSPEADAALAVAGVQHHVLPPAVAANECRPGTPRPSEFPHDIVFVGSARPYAHSNEWPFRDRMVRWLTDTYGPRFAHHGPGGRPTIRNGINGNQSALNDLYASARVVAGDCIHRHGYVSDRLTETLGRGGILVFPRTPTVDRLGYIDGIHYIGYEPGNLDALDWAIADAANLTPAARDAMRTAAMAHTRARHTFTHRMATLLDVVGLT